jgi:hypothetical protein
LKNIFYLFSEKENELMKQVPLLEKYIRAGWLLKEEMAIPNNFSLNKEKI